MSSSEESRPGPSRRTVIGSTFAVAAAGFARPTFAAAGPRMVKALKVHAPGGFDNLRAASVEVRAPGPGEITVRVRASSLNYHDLGLVRGYKRANPVIPLSDGAGEVVEVGPGVTAFKPGDAVISMFFPTWEDDRKIPLGFSTVPGDGVDGFATELVTRPVGAFTLAPKSLSHREAATLCCAGVTAWRALMVNGALKPGETVLTLGTGGVAVFAAQFALMMGAKVISTTSSEEKAQRLRAMGVSDVINYRTTENWGEVVKSRTGGIGVDHVVETGGKGTFPQSILAARTSGHIAVIGGVAGGMAEIAGSAVLQNRLRIMGILVASRQDQNAMVKAIDAKGTFKPVLDSDFPLDKLGDAFRHEESGAHIGKITISI